MSYQYRESKLKQLLQRPSPIFPLPVIEQRFPRVMSFPVDGVVSRQLLCRRCIRARRLLSPGLGPQDVSSALQSPNRKVRDRYRAFYKDMSFHGVF